MKLIKKGKTINQIIIENHYGVDALDEAQIESLVEGILLSEEHKKEWHINLVLISDEIITDIHNQYLHDNSPTDVISFDLSEDFEEYYEGEIYISIDRASAQAGEFGVTFKSELYRLIAHGILHLLGYDDLTDNDRQIMREQENKILQKFNLF